LNNKIIIGVVAVIIGVSIIGGYYYSGTIISEASEEMFETVWLEDVRLENMTIFPPSMKLVAIYSLYNPTEYSLNLKIDLDFLLNDEKLSELIVDEVLRPDSEIRYEIVFPMDANLIDLFEQEAELDDFVVNGLVSVGGTGFVFPTTYTIRYVNEDAMNVLPYFNETAPYSEN